MWVLIWLYETKILRKYRIMLQGSRKFYGLHKEEEIYAVIAKNVWARFGISNNE